MTTPRNNTLEHQSEESKIVNEQKHLIHFTSGLISGVICAGAFNPWDRALYLTTKHNRSFLLWDNFKAPYHGFAQTVIQRTYSNGIYYIIQGEVKSFLRPHLQHHQFSPSASQFCIGTVAGSLYALSTNSLAAIKYHTWGNENHSFRTSMNEMWSHGKFKPFCKGTGATLCRDTIFGSAYEVTRNIMRIHLKKINPELNVSFISNMTAAGIATALSGPFNYARSIQYATPPGQKPPTICQSLTAIWQESKNHSQPFFGRARFFQQQFRIGWGTARVAIGMAAGQAIVDYTNPVLEQQYSNFSKK